MPPFILPLLQLLQAIGPDLVKAWRNMHINDPAKAMWTDAEAFADLIKSGEHVADKWAAYKRDNP
jgi:hypothetical protein